MQPTTMNLPRLVVDLNNKAVGALLQGDCDGSVSSLATALSSLQVFREAETAATSGGSPSLSLHQALNPQQHNQRQQEHLSWALKLLESMKLGDSPLASVPLDHECLVDCSGSFSVFNHALTIDNINELDGSVTKNYERIQAMLLYNMALSLHYHAILSGKSEELRGALDLYEMAFSVVENSWQRFDLDDLMLLLMALLNNLGHIHSSLYNTQQTQTCVDWLKTLAGHPAFLKLMQRDQYAGFSMNLLVVLKQQQHCSPAA